MAPEWDLFKERCVLDPNQRPQGLPRRDCRSFRVTAPMPNRLYRLARHWNEYLSCRAADSVTALFAGAVVAEPNRRVLCVPAVRTRRLVSPDYAPALEVETVLDQLLVGLVAGSGPVSDGSVNASTALDLQAALRAACNTSTLSPCTCGEGSPTVIRIFGSGPCSCRRKKSGMTMQMHKSERVIPCQRISTELWRRPRIDLRARIPLAFGRKVLDRIRP